MSFSYATEPVFSLTSRLAKYLKTDGCHLKTRVVGSKNYRPGGYMELVQIGKHSTPIITEPPPKTRADRYQYLSQGDRDVFAI